MIHKRKLIFMLRKNTICDSVPLQWCWAVNHSNSYSHEHTHKLETLKIKKKKGNTWYKMIKKLC